MRDVNDVDDVLPQGGAGKQTWKWAAAVPGVNIPAGRLKLLFEAVGCHGLGMVF